MEPRHLVGRQIGAGRVVRVGDEDDAGALGDARQKPVDIGSEVPLGDSNRGRADRLGADRVHQKAVPAVEHLAARRLAIRPGIGAQQQPDQLVGTGAAHDPVRIEPVMAAERAAQFGRAAVGIAVDLSGQRPIGGDRLGAGPERTFIGRQADRPLGPGSGRVAADIGGDVEDARPGDRGGRGRHRLNLLRRRRRYRAMSEPARSAAATARPR